MRNCKWAATPIAVQQAARYYFATLPAARTVLATPDGTLFHDDADGERWAVGHANVTGAAVLRLTRAGRAPAFTPRRAAGPECARPAWQAWLTRLFTGRSTAI